MNTTSPVTSLSGDELACILEPLIRRVVREELVRIAHQKPDIFPIAPGMPIYEDLIEILERKSSQELVFYAHEEVWDE